MRKSSTSFPHISKPRQYSNTIPKYQIENLLKFLSPFSSALFDSPFKSPILNSNTVNQSPLNIIVTYSTVFEFNLDPANKPLLSNPTLYPTHPQGSTSPA
jgi:hypothetical protein